jgi:hypothetical protein
MFAWSRMRLLRCLIPLAVSALLSTPLLAAAPELEGEFIMRISTINFDECDPIVIRSKVMEVHPKKGTIVVAEKEVREMDVSSDGRRIKTTCLKPDGNPDSIGSFRVGQYVRVEGFLHPDGYIAALSIQRIEKPVEKPFRYKPIEAAGKSFRKKTAAHYIP